MRRITYFTVVALLAGSSHGAKSKQVPVEEPGDVAPPEPPPAEPHPAGRFHPPLGFDRLGLADGLPQSTVHAVVQDAAGFLWFGTENGLARYDGSKMRVYRHDAEKKDSLADNSISALAVDATGKLWVGTSEKGISVLDPATDRFTSFAPAKDDPCAPSAASVTAIHADRAGRLWFATSDGGLDLVEPKATCFRAQGTPLEGSTGGITSLASDAEGALWLGTQKRGVVRWNPSGGATVFSLLAKSSDAVDQPAVTTLAVDAKGRVWVGTAGDGLYALDPAHPKQRQEFRASKDEGSLSNDNVTSLLLDATGTLWVGTLDGLNRLDASGRRFVRYVHDPAAPWTLSSRWVTSLYQDRGGVIWVGMFAAGLNKFDWLRLRFGHHHLAHPAVCFLEDPDGTLWVGTNNGGLHRYDRATGHVTVIRSVGRAGGEDPIDLDSTWVSSLFRSRRGTLWMGVAEEGLLAFDPADGSYERHPASGEPLETVWAIHEDAQGILWLATWGGGLVRYDPRTQAIQAFTAESVRGLGSSYLYVVTPDPKDPAILWLGTAKGGLVRFSTQTHEAKSFRHDPNVATSLSHDDVLSVHVGHDGMVWAGTYGGGLNRVDPISGKVDRFTRANSKLTDDVVYAVLEDDAGALWLSTNGGGLLRFDPARNDWVHYTARDGLQGDEFAGGGYLKGRKGEMFFGGVGGFNAFLPSAIQLDRYAPSVTLTGYRLNNKEATPGRSISTLPPLHVAYSDSFELEFAAMSFAAPQQARYAYKLEGIDDDWVETDRHFAAYTKLSGGHYTFRVRSANRHGVWSKDVVSIKVAVTPPPWRSGWAYGLYGGIVCAALAGSLRYQRRRFAQLQREARLASVEKDLALSGALQEGFLPKTAEVSQGNLRLQGFYRPADVCSGDWWWFDRLQGDTCLIIVGDVTGHGPGPAMVTAAVAAGFGVLAEMKQQSVTAILDHLNKLVIRISRGSHFMTLTAVEIDQRTGHYTVYSAGAPPLFALKRSGGQPQLVHAAGNPLGASPNFLAGTVHGKLEKRERLFIHTDGIMELPMGDGRLFGMRRLRAVLEGSRSFSLPQAVTHIVAQADQARAGKPQDDDWTFVVLEWAGPGGDA